MSQERIVNGMAFLCLILAVAIQFGARQNWTLFSNPPPVTSADVAGVFLLLLSLLLVFAGTIANFRKRLEQLEYRLHEADAVFKQKGSVD